MDEHGSLDLAMGRDTQCVETIIDKLVDLTSPALKARLAATESALHPLRLGHPGRTHPFEREKQESGRTRSG